MLPKGFLPDFFYFILLPLEQNSGNKKCSVLRKVRIQRIIGDDKNIFIVQRGKVDELQF